MIKVEKLEDVYPAIDELINQLSNNDNAIIARTIYHRMYKVSWSCRDELLEELYQILNNVIISNSNDLTLDIKQQIAEINNIIKNAIPIDNNV